MAIGNPNFGRFEKNDEEVYRGEEEEITDPDAETEDDILERIDREKEEKKRKDEERRETPLAIDDHDDEEDLPVDPAEKNEEHEEERDLSQFEDGSLPSRIGTRKDAEVKDSNARLHRKPEKKFYRTKKIQEDKRFKKKKAA